MITQLKGVEVVLKRLRKVSTDNAKRVETGVVKAGLFLQRQSQLVVPVDTGNLKGSAFTRKQGRGFDTEAVVGYTANYALFVHENLNARHKAGKQAKFLEGPARKFLPQIKEIIRNGGKGGT